ncbi:MAG: SpaA isopeptide-forming pilin-related protein [Oscillospiraceae bacterium]|nr:SpaA isopeptide-forming pilin-related protein [Oscillospiraceae bacterium]
MKFKMKKILSISIVLLIIMNALYSTYAFSGTKEIRLVKWCENYFTYKGNTAYVPYVAYSKDGKTLPAYCVNPNVPGVGSEGVNSYNVEVKGKITNEAVWKVLINSYPYKTLSELGAQTEEEVFYATKLAVYTVLENRNPNDYKPVDSEAARRVYQVYLKILNLAKNSNEILTNNDKISIIQTEDWKIEDNYLSKTYSVNSIIKNGKFNIEMQGNLPKESKLVDESNIERNQFSSNEKFKIIVPVEKIDEIYEFSLKASSTLKTYPIYFGKATIAGKQDYALVGETTEDLTCSLSDKTIKNTTKIRIIKKEYGSEKRLAGVKFNLLDANKNPIQKNLVTDDAGEVEITKLLPGKYFIQEIETLEGYNLYQDLIEVNIVLNEEMDVVVNNTINSVTEVSKDAEVIEVIENKTEKVYKSDITQSNVIKKLPVTGY